MKVNLAGRVKNLELPRARPLLPLLEAISNSIHSIEDSGRKDGYIRIRVLRDKESLFQATTDSKSLAAIVGFEVTDNGEGFNDSNFESFESV